MVKTLKSKHKKDLSKKRSFRQSAGMNPPGNTPQSPLQAPPEVPKETQGQLDYDDYPRSAVCKKIFDKEAAYNLEMSLANKYLEMLSRDIMFKNDKLEDLVKMAKEKKESPILKKIVNDLLNSRNTELINRFLVSYLSLKYPEKQHQKCTSDDNIFKYLQEILELMCFVSKHFDQMKGTRSFFSRKGSLSFLKSEGQKNNINEVRKRLVQVFMSFFYDFCVNGEEQISFAEWTPLLKTMTNTQISNYNSKLQNLKTLLKDSPEAKNNQKIFFYLCLKLIGSNLDNVVDVNIGVDKMIENFNQKITTYNAENPNNQIPGIDPGILNPYLEPGPNLSELFAFIFNKVQGESSLEDISTLNIKFNKTKLQFLTESSFRCPEINGRARLGSGAVDSLRVGVYCPPPVEPQNTGGKKSRKATSKTRKPKTLKRPLRANHRIKKAASVESRKRVSKNRNTSHRRA